MTRTTRRAALGATAVLTLASAGLLGGSGAAATNAQVTGVFSRHLVGTSHFTEVGNSVTVNGVYSGLMPNRAYFTVVYGNTNCDPAQAFPVGPFRTTGIGSGTIAMTVTDSSGVAVAAARSVSVRRGDNSTDIDHDGKLGPTDVVAVAGRPSVGLIECDRNPVR